MALEPAGVRLVAENASGFQSALSSAGKAVTGFLGLVAGAGVAVAGGLVAGLTAGAAAGLGFNNSLEQSSARIQAFTKDADATAAVLEMVRRRAAETPFEFDAMAEAAASLGPVAKSSGKDLEGLIAQAEILAASNPAEGLAGAAFALREAASGDFASVIERFNLSRQYLNQLKAEGVPALEAVGMAMKQAGYDADLVTNLANTASGRLSTLSDTFTNLAGIVTQPFFDTFSSSLGDVNKILADNAPLLDQAAQGLGQILAPAAQMLGDIMRGAATGLVNFARNLPTIAAQAGRVAGVLMAVVQTARQWWTALSPLLGQALSWGANFIGQLAKGMLDAASVVLSALMQIGAIITSWLAPGSPPKLLPDLPEWGTSAVNQFMAGWATPDLSAFDTLSGTIEQMLRDLVPTGAVDEAGALGMIFGSRDAIARAVEEFRTLGSVSEDAFGAIRDAAGPAGQSAERFARAYFEVEEASREVAKAQGEVEEATRAVDDAQKALNDTLSAFDAILNPLNKQLQGIQDRKQEIKDAQRVAELQEELASGKLDEQEAELARLEIAEIQTEAQIRGAEREKEAAAEVAQANVDAATEAQTAAEARLSAAEEAEAAAQAQLDREVAAIGLQSEQNRLIGEQISLLEKLAQAASKGAGGTGGAGGLGSLAGAGAGVTDVVKTVEETTQAIEEQVEKVNEVAQNFSQGIQEAKANTERAINEWMTNIRNILDGFADGPSPETVMWVKNMAAGWIADLRITGQQLGAWVIEQAPIWGAQLATLGSKLGGWVMEALPGLITALADARTALVTWVLDSLPGWAAELDKLRTAMIDWVAASLPDLGTNLGKITALLLSKTGEFIATVGPKLLELAGKFVVWVATEALPRLPGEMAKLGVALVQGIANFVKEVAPELDKLATQFIQWIGSEVLPNLPAEVAKIGSALVKGISDFSANVGAEAVKVGEAIVDGLAGAIRDGAARAVEAARKLAQSLPEWVRKVLGIASPSKVMAALGTNAGDSFAQGILDTIPAALKAAQQLAEETRDKVIKELERLAKDVQTFMAERLSGRIGLARSAIGGLDALKDAARELRDLQDEQVAVGNEIAAFEEEQAKRRIEEYEEIMDLARQVDAVEIERQKAAEKSAQKIAELEAERAIAAITAAQNLDPEKRQKALEAMAEIDKAIAEERERAANADLAFEERKNEIRAQGDAARMEAYEAEIEAAERLNQLEEERAEIGRQIMIAAERERYIREETIKAQAAAAKFAETDPVFAQQFLSRRQGQISELADLRAELASTSDVGTRAIIQEQIRLLEAAMALELEQLQQEGAARAEEIAQLGQPGTLGDAAGDEFLAKFGKALGDGAPQLAAGLIAAIEAAFVGLTAGLTASLPGPGSVYSPIAPPGAVGGSSSTSYGDQNVTIQAGGFTVSQLKAVIREVLSEQARSASNTARGTA